LYVEIESRDNGDPTSSIRRDLVQVDGLFSNCILQEDESTDDSSSKLFHPDAPADEEEEDDVDEDDESSNIS